jgi:hypothetical protein
VPSLGPAPSQPTETGKPSSLPNPRQVRIANSANTRGFRFLCFEVLMFRQIGHVIFTNLLYDQLKKVHGFSVYIL